MKTHTIKIQAALLICFILFNSGIAVAANIYLEAQGDIHNYSYKKAYEAMAPLAKQGDVLATRLLTYLYFYGSKTKLYGENDNPYYNEEKGFYWARKAADTGDIYALWELAHLIEGHYPGDSIKQIRDRKQEALKWHLKAADKGHPDSLFWLGKYHLSGYLGKWDHVKAYKWFTLSARRIEPEPGQANSSLNFAQRALRSMIRGGEATPKVIKEALHLVEQWEKEHPNAIKRWTYMQTSDELCDHPSVFKHCSPETKRKKRESGYTFTKEEADPCKSRYIFVAFGCSRDPVDSGQANSTPADPLPPKSRRNKNETSQK